MYRRHGNYSFKTMTVTYTELFCVETLSILLPVFACDDAIFISCCLQFAYLFEHSATKLHWILFTFVYVRFIPMQAVIVNSPKFPVATHQKEVNQNRQVRFFSVDVRLSHQLFNWRSAKNSNKKVVKMIRVKYFALCVILLFLWQHIDAAKLTKSRGKKIHDEELKTYIYESPVDDDIQSDATTIYPPLIEEPSKPVSLPITKFWTSIIESILKLVWSFRQIGQR